jgi:hypothetical protein
VNLRSSECGVTILALSATCAQVRRPLFALPKSSLNVPALPALPAGDSRRASKYLGALACSVRSSEGLRLAGTARPGSATRLRRLNISKDNLPRLCTKRASEANVGTIEDCQMARPRPPMLTSHSGGMAPAAFRPGPSSRDGLSSHQIIHSPGRASTVATMPCAMPDDYLRDSVNGRNAEFTQRKSRAASLVVIPES